MPGTLTFVLCIESNAICAQALLLCESIRAFGGRHRAAPIVAVSPRQGHGILPETRARLEALEVEYVEADINVCCPEYGPANRVFAAAWAERHAKTEWVAVLDSDTVLLAELDLPPEVDAAARPVDVKGSATSGPGDPRETYWAQLAELQRISLDRLPFLSTTVTHERIRASYNGGLIVTRREKGILRASADLFERSVGEGLKPWHAVNHEVFASTGPVGRAASAYWGSSQAAAAVAIWGTTTRVHSYPETYNIPLHLLTRRRAFSLRRRRASLVHVHYHWMFGEPYYERGLRRLRAAGVPQDQLNWLRARTPIR